VPQVHVRALTRIPHEQFKFPISARSNKMRDLAELNRTTAPLLDRLILDPKDPVLT
jgi:hypothetical protein